MTNYILDSNPLAHNVTRAIQTGDLSVLKVLLQENPGLASASIQNAQMQYRTLLHIATDYPGHFPNDTETISLLIAAGADVNAEFMGGCHTETPLHWAASSNNISAIDLLIENGANIEAKGGVIGGGTALSDATAFGQWDAAYRLIQLGAKPTLFDMAALELMDKLEESFAREQPPEDEINSMFWGACHGGRVMAAKFLLGHKADINWVPTWENRTPLDAAIRSSSPALIEWLRLRGAKTYDQLFEQ